MKKEILLVILVLILGVLITVGVNKFKYEPTQKKVSTETKEEKIDEDKLINDLYNMVSIDNASTEPLDYYENEKTSLENISPTLLSYLLLKNLDKTKEEISYDEISETLIKIFNNDSMILQKYEAPYSSTNYILDYYTSSNSYKIRTETQLIDLIKLEKNIKSYNIKDNEITIIEEYTITENYTEKKGLLTYTFKKDNAYYLDNVVNNNIE